MAQQPAGITFKRDNADVMNNFFINMVSYSFTNIEEVLKVNAEDNNAKAVKETLTDFKKVENVWTNKIKIAAEKEMNKFDNTIQTNNTKRFGNEVVIANQMNKTGGSMKGSKIEEDLNDLIDMN